MGRTKWKNRSKEDQERILKEQQAMREPKKKPGWFEDNDHVAKKIYRRLGFPIRCMEHGWVESDLYELKPGKDPFGQDRNFVIGNCSICKKEIKRIYPPMGIDEIMFATMVLSDLMLKGRLKDLRK